MCTVELSSICRENMALLAKGGFETTYSGEVIVSGPTEAPPVLKISLQ